LRALYVSHTAHVSGGERSLLDLLGALPASVHAHVATPRGRLRDALGELGIATTPIAGTAGSLRAHPLHTPVAIAQLAVSAAQVSRAARRQRAQILHANSIRAGIIVGLARAPHAAKVVHVRDCLPPGALTTATTRLIAASATTIVANSRYTADALLACAPGAPVEVVHNAVDLTRFDPKRIERGAARARLEGVEDGRLLLGVVAQLSPWKGQDTAIEALSLLRAEGIDAHLLLIGSAKFLARATRYDNDEYLRGLRALARSAGVEDRVSSLGEREDVPELMRALDVLLAPSWEEPFGRTVVEAMALEVPVLATNLGGPGEIITDGREGLLLAPRQPPVWADALRALAADPERRARMGRAGRERVEHGFTLAEHAQAMLAVYSRALVRTG
jgi:glycosyltransferase involved in cell wall biosynthesis